MRFLTKINRNYLFLLITVLVIFSFGGYFVFQTIILQEAKESLMARKTKVIEQIDRSGEIVNFYPDLEIKEIPGLTGTADVFNEVYIQNEIEDELEPYLEYASEISVDGKTYLLKIRQSLFEKEDLVLILACTLILLLGLAFLITFSFTRKMNKTVWSKFETNLKQIEQFSFSGNNELQLLNSNIDEFNRLNKVVNALVDKLKSDYNALKEFTENASHEIQTPIAVALVNLDELLQQDLSEDAFAKVVATINSLKRLSTLNKSLILLTKIDNQQFAADEIIRFTQLFEQKFGEFEALISTRTVILEKDFQEEFELKMNRQLADILVSNLLSNAINHNVSGGKIQVKIHANGFSICNTGQANKLNNETIFNRFAKGNTKTFGLGLAIVKDICDTNSLTIQYDKSEMHCFKITSLE